MKQIALTGMESPEALKGDRVVNDYYPTPHAVVMELKKILVSEGLYSPSSHVVFSPCAGEGAILQHFGRLVFGNEPFWSGTYKPSFSLDASLSKSWIKFDDGDIDWTIENPPYGNNFPEKLLPLAWTHSRVGVALHLRITWIEGVQGRRELMNDLWDHLRFVQSINPRAQFRRNSKGSDSCTTAWFVWAKDWSWRAQGISNPFQYILDWR